jgi:hypothetical protein
MGPSHGLARRSLPLTGLLCLALIVIQDWLFHDHPAGWTVGLFGLLLMAAITVRGGRYLRLPPGRWLAAALLGLILVCFLEPGWLPVLLGAGGLIALAFIDRCGWTGDAGRWLHRGGRFLIMIPAQPFLDRARMNEWFESRGGRRWRIGCGIAAWAIPILLTLLFLLLFWAANPVLARWIGSLGEELRHLLDEVVRYLDVLRILWWVLTGLGAWALLRVRARDRARGATPLSTMSGFDRLATPALIIRCLVLFNALFLIQTGMDVYFLWGGGDLPAGMTYAHYARRGAYPLVAAALLAAAFVLATFRAGAPVERRPWARGLVFLWVAQNIFLTINAMHRLGLYVEAYSLTRLRCAAAIWMALVAIGLALIVWRIVRRRSNAWLVSANVLTALATLYICCFINFNGFIARYNVRHCRELTGTGVPIDLSYLRRLGPEALPALRLLGREVEDPAVRAEAEACRAMFLLELDEQLSNWRGLTFRRLRLARDE